LKKKNASSPYQQIVSWFGEGNKVDVMLLEQEKMYRKQLESIPGLNDLVDSYSGKLSKNDRIVMMEFILFALAEHSIIGKNHLERGVRFNDILGSIFSEKDIFGDQ